MQSYLDILNELQETVNTDVIIEQDRIKINETIKQLLELLWKYSS